MSKNYRIGPGDATLAVSGVGAGSSHPPGNAAGLLVVELVREAAAALDRPPTLK